MRRELLRNPIFLIGIYLFLVLLAACKTESLLKFREDSSIVKLTNSQLNYYGSVAPENHHTLLQYKKQERE